MFRAFNKEPFMRLLQPFITEMMSPMKAFISELQQLPLIAPPDEVRTKLTPSDYQMLLSFLVRKLRNALPNVEKELASIKKDNAWIETARVFHSFFCLFVCLFIPFSFFLSFFVYLIG